MKKARPPAIILMKPQLGENIGTTARAMRNFGFSELHLAAARPGWSRAKARASAAGGAALLSQLQTHETLEEALAPFGFVLATSARPRALAKPVHAPDEAIDALFEAQRTVRAAILFGPERTGLSNADLDLCDAIVMIPADSVFPSLNLAQSALLLCYLWRQKSLSPPPPRPSLPPPLASKEEILGFFEHLEGELDRENYFHPPERRAAMVRNLRTLFQRCSPSSAEIRALRGIVAALARRRNRG